MDAQDEIIECPCYRVCAGLGLEMKRWCRYRKSDLPPPGMHRLDPKEDWCPTGVQANVLMLGYLLAEQTASSPAMQEALTRVRQWAREAREANHG